MWYLCGGNNAMDKDKFYRTLRLIGAICSFILGVIGALGINVPSIQEYLPAGIVAIIVAFASEVTNHWFNNNYTEGAKLAQPSIKEYNMMLKAEADHMGKGDEDE